MEGPQARFIYTTGKIWRVGAEAAITYPPHTCSTFLCALGSQKKAAVCVRRISLVCAYAGNRLLWQGSSKLVDVTGC